MRRRQLFEIEDQPWCPRWLRNGMTDYLREMVRRSKPYAPATDVLAAELQSAADAPVQVVDLASGAGGPWPTLAAALAERGVNVHVTLTDVNPNESAAQWIASTGAGRLAYHTQSVSATTVPPGLGAYRTMFSALHHFPPTLVRDICAAAARDGVGFAAFEATHRSPGMVASMIFVPIACLLLTPTIRPVTATRLFFTYLMPIIPLASWWDGVVSALRTYEAGELREIVAGLETADYEWIVGEARAPRAPFPVTYLIGRPRRPVS